MDNNYSEFPIYTSHKLVRAARVISVGVPEVGSRLVTIVLELPGKRIRSVEVVVDFIFQHKPKAGGYLVVYSDGYTSYSPAEPFEAGYTMTNGAVKPTGYVTKQALEGLQDPSIAAIGVSIFKDPSSDRVGVFLRPVTKATGESHD